MKKLGWRAILLFGMAFFSTLLVTAPATLLAKVVADASKGQLVLANASGTVWQGSAIPAIRQRSGSLLALEKLHWDVALLPLFTGKITSQFRWDNVVQDSPMMATISFGQIELRNLVLPLYAGILGELSPLLQPVQLSGRMQIRSDQLTFSKQGMKGSAVAEWSDAGSVLSSVRPLGNYRINLAGAGERLDIALLTTSGVLLLEGKGSFAVAQGLKFQGTARAAADSKGSLNELLSNFGPESAPGVHSLNLMR
jgi:general secretion pathway protein N